MARRDVLLTDEQWIKIAPLLPTPKASRKGGRTATLSARALIDRGASSGLVAKPGTKPQRTVPRRRSSPLRTTTTRSSPGHRL